MPTETDLQQRFEACVDAYADSLFRVAYRLTGNETMARELVSETYLNAWQNLSTLSDLDKMRGWMFSILRNQYTKILRAEKKATATTDQFAHVAATSTTENDQNLLVQDALESLDDKFKLPLLLVAMEQLSVDEAAGVLQLPRGTVLSRLHRGRQKLKEHLIRADEQFAALKQKSDSDAN